MPSAHYPEMNEKLMAVLMAMLVALMPFSIDAYLPAIPEMAQSLNADVHRIEQSLSLFMFGTAFGQVVGGSVSDIKGRKPVALAGLTVYCLAVAAIAFASSAEQLLNLRVVQAFGAGMTVVIVGAMVRDYYSGRKAAQMFALIGIILMVVPLAAPMAGAVLQSLGGWQAIFVFFGGLFAGAACTGAAFPAQARRRRQNRTGRVRIGSWAVQTCFANTRRDGLSVFSGIQLRLDVCFFDRIVFCVPAALPRYAAPIRLGVRAQYHHDDVFQPYYRVAAQNRRASAKHPAVGDCRPVCRQPVPTCRRAVLGAAAVLAAGRVRDVFGRYAGLGRREHAGVFYVLF